LLYVLVREIMTQFALKIAVNTFTIGLPLCHNRLSAPISGAPDATSSCEGDFGAMRVREQVAIRAFCAEDQEAAKALVLAGLGERWGWIDPTLNPDLDDIAASYAAGLFLVGYLGDTLVATGALLPEATAEGVHAQRTIMRTEMRVVRMSVRADLRGQGIGRRMLDALIDAARQQGCALVVLETTSTWTDAIGFYTRNGFQLIEERDGDTHMQLDMRQLE
jgi:GNAT superfamily N-acetyltransferase